MDTVSDRSTLQALYERDPAIGPAKRHMSDTFASLAPSPLFREAAAAVESGDTKHEHAIVDDAPRTPRRQQSLLARGLQLQMPPRSARATTPSHSGARTPLSPQLDATTPYASPQASIPRHSRGLDFSRASTNLHHSTLAESSPDSSPIITQRSVNIPSRKGSVNSMMLDSPALGPQGTWPAFTMDRSAVSSSMGSVNMLASLEGSSESEDDDLSDDATDEVMSTPQAQRMSGPQQYTPYNAATASPNVLAGAWSNNFSPATASLMKNFRQGRLRQGRSRKSSGSTSGAGSQPLPSPRTTSPPPQAVVRSIETAANGYFGWGNKFSNSRRESLALGTDNLNLSSGNDSGDETGISPGTTKVVRRAVTRRGSMLPKTKGLIRIRAQLAEESQPVDTEVRREAETIKQVLERSDSTISSTTNVSQRSPGLHPTVPGLEHGLEDIPEDSDGGGSMLDDAEESGRASGSSAADKTNADGSGKGMAALFATTAAHHANTAYWDRLDKSFRTPPPPSSSSLLSCMQQQPATLRHNSSAMSDINMESPSASSEHGGGSRHSSSSNLLLTASNASNVALPTASPLAAAAAAPKKTVGKRARDEDIDPASIKRRAVSPSLSVSGASGGGAAAGGAPGEKWGDPPPPPTPGTAQGERQYAVPRRSESGDNVSGVASVQGQQHNGNSNSAGQQAGGGGPGPGVLGTPGKRVGMQIMTDTNDGLMKMCLE